MAQRTQRQATTKELSAKEHEREVREWLGGQMRQRQRRVPEPVWSKLRKDGNLSDVLGDNDNDRTREHLLRDARTRLRDYRVELERARVKKRRRDGRAAVPRDEIRQDIDLADCLGEVEALRARVISNEMVRVAEKQVWGGLHAWGTGSRPGVVHFRERVLNGRLVYPATAARLMGSIGAALFEPGFFEANSIPLLEHDSMLRDGPEGKLSVALGPMSPESTVEFRWENGTHVAPLGDRFSRLGIAPEGSVHRHVIVNEDSVLAWLDSVSSALSLTCHWREDEAALFILTGVPPQVMPIDIGPLDYSLGGDHLLMRVELSVHPWVSAGALLEVYKRLQRIIVGARNRAPEIRSLKLFDLVAKLRHEGKSYGEALTAWIAKNPSERKRFKKRDKTAVSRFTSQFKDIERQVLRPFGDRDAVKAGR